MWQNSPLAGWGDGEGKGQRGGKYTNASEQLQFAGRASERTTWQQGAWQPPEAARPAEHSAGRDALVHTRASPTPEGDLWGWGAHRKAQPSPQTCGGEADLPSPPPQQPRPAAAGKERVPVAGNAPATRCWNVWVGVSYRQRCVWGTQLPIMQAMCSPCTIGTGKFKSRMFKPFMPELPDLLSESFAPSPRAPASLPLAKAGTHLDAGSLA